MDRQQAKHIIKNTGYIGNEVGVAFDVAIKSMDKLEKIGQILQTRSFTDDIGNACYLDDSERVKQIREILEQE